MDQAQLSYEKTLSASRGNPYLLAIVIALVILLIFLVYYNYVMGDSDKKQEVKTSPPVKT